HALYRSTHPRLYTYNSRTPSHSSTLSLHDALPISNIFIWEDPASDPEHYGSLLREVVVKATEDILRMKELEGETLRGDLETRVRSEELTSELQSRFDLVCRLLLEKKHIVD